MDMFLHINGQMVSLDMEQNSRQVITVGSYRYRPSRMAQRVRKLAKKLWGHEFTFRELDSRLYFETPDNAYDWRYEGDAGSFTAAHGASVRLGRWSEQETIGIALHELAHEMHLRSGNYDRSDDVVREALALLVEREVGLIRTFDHDPYYTASNLVEQLYTLWAFKNQPFQRRWHELIEITSDCDLADLVNYYLDRNEGLGLSRWLERYSHDVEVREALLRLLSECSLHYSLEYRRALLRNLVRSSSRVPMEQFMQVFDAIIALDERHPHDDMKRIIDFCFASVPRSRRGLFGTG